MALKPWFAFKLKKQNKVAPSRQPSLTMFVHVVQGLYSAVKMNQTVDVTLMLTQKYQAEL